jgi:sec-independent protein translocase protein TatA
MPGKLGFPEIAIILVIALLIFGPSKLSGVGRGLGEGIRNFKNAMRGDETPTNPEQKK